MQLTCPSCETKFAIDADQIGASGRQVRCGSCGHKWFQEPPAEATDAGDPPTDAPADSGDAAAAIAAADATADPDSAPGPAPSGVAPVIEPSDRPTRPRRIPRERPTGPVSRGLAAGWLLFVFVAVVLAAGVYFGQEPIVARFPAAGDLYRVAGLSPEDPPAGAGLELRDVTSARRTEDGARVIVIAGVVANVSEREQSVPLLRASMTDADGRTVDEWTFPAADATVAPGEITAFETTTMQAPIGGSLTIDFVPLQ